MSIEKHKSGNLSTLLHLKLENFFHERLWLRDKLLRVEYLIISIPLLLFTGCAGMNAGQQTFTPIDQKENPAILKKIQKNTKEFRLAKCKIKLSILINLNSEKKDYSARAICLWQPGKKIRMRISHILAGTIADILFDGKIWYITDEPNGKIYITKRIDTIRIAGIPNNFFIQMQRLPQTWLPANGKNIKIGINDDSYQIIKQNSDEKFEWIFQHNSAFPSKMKIDTEANGNLIAAFSKPETNIQYHARMFKPMLNDYEMIKLD